jgi:two-component system sensor histidine kinase KdpD
MEERRPTPEEMLALATREDERARRGRLKIYFGAAPGVGKTYTMLEAAQVKKRAGLDVAIGWIETHGRRETEELARGLERLAPREVEYRGVLLREFDLDAALARRPQLLLVDELAHTNAAGSRHARRWQDVEELLEAGIDVETTLNVQHVESLNDVVAQITGVTVRETVPDSLFDRADEIELIDLPSDELLERLKQGKVYIPAQAERAAQSFFRKGNLIALRELALRRAAERVDEQANEWKKEHGIAQAWATRERLLVAVTSSKRSANVVRAAYRTATRLRAPWIALLVETPEIERLPREDRELVDGALDIAERLGAETLVVRGELVADEILAVARERNVTRIVVGKPAGGWRDWLRNGPVLARLVRDSGEAEVQITTGEQTDERTPARSAPRRPTVLANYLWALVIVLVSTLICLLTQSLLTLADQTMIYLLGVLIVSSRLPRRPSLFAGIASVAALDFFFVPPEGTFAFEDLRFGVTFLVMLVVAVTVSTFTVRLREQAEAAEQRERRTASLFAMSRQFVIETGVGEIAATAVKYVGELLETEALVLLADRAGNLLPCGGNAPLAASEREMAAARWVHENGRLAGHGTQTLPSAEGLYIPLIGTAGHLGVFAIAMAKRADPPTPSQWQVLETFVAQTALALERALLVQRSAIAQVAMETERTRGELLSAVTHDVRTPLAAIRGAAETLLDDQGRIGEAARREMLETVRDESQRLSRLIGELLDLTRLESGVLPARKEPYPVDELFDSALSRLERELAGRVITCDLPDEVLLVPVDAVLMEQVLFNLLENAAKYSAPGTPIDVRARREPEGVVLEVADRGPGLPVGQEEKVFEKFYRADDGSRAAGTGLGLTVCRAIVRAHGGTITAENRAGGGALFRVMLPFERESALDKRLAGAESPRS